MSGGGRVCPGDTPYHAMLPTPLAVAGANKVSLCFYLSQRSRPPQGYQMRSPLILVTRGPFHEPVNVTTGDDFTYILLLLL